MSRLPIEHAVPLPDVDWMPFPGGELEGSRPRVLCPECRARLQAAVSGASPAASPALCFQCYRLDLERTRRIRAAGELNTASEARFQTALPFEPVNRTRLAQLKAERQAAREAGRAGVGLYIEKRRRAQIEARSALGRVLLGLKERRLLAAQRASMQAVSDRIGGNGRRQPLDADLRIPASWLPFVVAG